MTKKQRHNARKKANRAQRAEQELQKEQNKPGKQREELKIGLVQSVQSKTTTQQAIEKTTHQVTTRSRSNVGAKIRPATPPPTNVINPIQQELATPALMQPFTPTPAALQSRLTAETGLATLPLIADTQRPEQPPTGLLANDRFETYDSKLGPPRRRTQHSGPNQFDPRTPLPNKFPTNLQAPVSVWRPQQGYSAQHQTASSSFEQSYPTTPSANPTLAGLNASLNAGLQTQYTSVETPYTIVAPPLPGFHIPTDGYPNIQPPPSFAPVQQLHHRLVPSSVKTTSGTSKKSKKHAAPRTREDRNIDFLQKLILRFPEDKTWLGALMPHKSSDKLLPNAIHVFIDASNILIGFNHTRVTAGLPQCDMSFDGLAFLLERRRPVAKRIYSGSTRVSAPIASNEKFNALAGDVGYEKNIFEQVLKTKELTNRQKFFQDVNRLGYFKANQMRRSGSSGGSSDSETGHSPSKTHPPPTPKWVEQGVDESLHLKMCQSIIDCEIPSTMVLATGDGAEAEYSDGFLSHVERALKKGWTVELVSWKQQTSSGYKSKRFRAKWGDKFKIIELDEFMEFMIDD
jgi:hypothetical protein